MNKEMYLTEHLALPSEATLSQTSELDGVHLTGCVADIRVFGIEQALRYAVILLNYADDSDQEFDELLIERSKKGTYWVHFAVRPKGNRRKVAFLQT